MNVFETHARIVSNYALYIRSFINIADADNLAPVLLQITHFLSTVLQFQQHCGKLIAVNAHKIKMRNG